MNKNTVCVETRRVISYKSNGEPNYETILQKLDFDLVFPKFLRMYRHNGYASASVKSVYIERTDKESESKESGDLFDECVAMLDKTQRELTEAPTRKTSEDLIKENEELKNKLNEVDRMLKELTGKKVDKKETDTDLEDLRDQYEAIFGEKPHARKQADTLRKEIEAAK